MTFLFFEDTLERKVTRRDILTEIIDQLYSNDWQDNELEYLSNVLRNLKGLLPDMKGAAA
jgi:hypothetical protein